MNHCLKRVFCGIIAGALYELSNVEREEKKYAVAMMAYGGSNPRLNNYGGYDYH